MRLRVKICGVTRAEDALLAARLGADAIGFVLWPGSPRRIAPARARAIGAVLPPFVTRVGVFVNAAPDEVARVAAEAALDVVQLHGDERPEEYGSVPARLIKSVALHVEADVAAAAALPDEVMPLVDAADAVRRGGTGRPADWVLAARLGERRHIVLAGGLTAENLADAVRSVRPWAVDVSSGVEAEPGMKSADRLEQLFRAAARLESEVV
jgi:phosphoribosylanthranilate isomerase